MRVLAMWISWSFTPARFDNGIDRAGYLCGGTLDAVGIVIDEAMEGHRANPVDEMAASWVVGLPVRYP